MKTILLCTYKYSNGNPANGVFDTMANFRRSLEDANGIVNHINFLVDEGTNFNGHDIGNYLIDLLSKNHVDVLVANFESEHDRFLIKKPILKTIREKFGVKVVGWSGDIVAPYSQNACAKYCDYVDLSWTTDAENPVKSLKGKSLWFPFPINTQYFYKDDTVLRDIDISYIGQTKYKDDLHKCYSRLGSSWKTFFHETRGWDHLHTGNYNYLPVQEYALAFKRSKISFNIGTTVSNLQQLKLRTLEILSCGAMLLEQESVVTAQKFTPYSEYVPFSDAADFADKVNYYLSHDDERVAIANRGNERIKNQYSNVLLWKTILERLYGRVDNDCGK